MRSATAEPRAEFMPTGLTLPQPRPDVGSSGKLSVPIATALALTAACDTLRRVTVSGQLLSGVFTAMAAALSLTALLAYMGLQVRGRRVPLAFWLFLAWAVACGAYWGVSKDGMQNLCIYGLFVAIATAAAYDDERSRTRTLDLVLRIGWLLSFVYAATLVKSGLGADEIIGARSFALCALVILALAVTNRANTASARYLPWVLSALIALSLSRTATAAATLLLVVRLSQTKRRWSWWRGSAAIAALAFTVDWVTRHVAVVHERVYGGDNSSLMGVRLNTSGRSKFWHELDFSAGPKLWLGNGPASSEARIQAVFGARIGHPHNDYLRLLYDYGIVGLSLWAVGFLLLAGLAIVNMRKAADPTERSIHLAAVLALLVTAVAMTTDNVVVYGFVMAPLALIVGASLSLSRRPVACFRPA